MVGRPVPTNIPTLITAIPVTALGPTGTELAMWLLSGIGVGLVLVGVWHALSSRRPSRQVAEPRQYIYVLDEAA